MPGQYSFPLNLPNSFLGFGRTRTLPEDPQDTPFGAEIDYAIFGSGGPRRSWEAAELIQVNKCPFSPHALKLFALLSCGTFPHVQ